MKQIRRPPPPSRAFDLLKTKTASTLTVDDYDSLVSNAFLEKKNMGLLKDIDLISKSKQSPSGPRAGSMKTVRIEPDDTGKITWFTPGTGEVWMVEAVAVQITSGGSATCYVTYTIDSQETPVTQVITQSGNGVLLEDDFNWPTSTSYIDENVTVSFGINGSFTECVADLILSRRR